MDCGIHPSSQILGIVQYVGIYGGDKGILIDDNAPTKLATPKRK